MKRELQGRYVTMSSVDEKVQTFVPKRSLILLTFPVINAIINSDT
jgi:hypothetical protein